MDTKVYQKGNKITRFISLTLKYTYDTFVVSSFFCLPRIRILGMDLKSFLKSLKLQESTISMIVGVIVILLVGFLAIRYITKNKTGDVLPPVETENTTESSLPTIHSVENGETLWSISEKYYGTGYNRERGF